MKNTVVLAFIAVCIMSCNLPTMNTAKTSVTLHKVFQEKSSTVTSVEFSPDGKYFLAQGKQTPVFVWQVKDLALYQEFKLIDLAINLFAPKDRPSSIVGAYFTPDSKSVFAGLNNGTAVTISLDSGDKISHSFGDARSNPRRSAISRSGKILAMDGSYLNTANNQLTNTLGMEDSGLVITDDDKYVVTGSYHLSSVKISEIATGKDIRWDPKSFFIERGVQSIDVSPDNDTIAAGLSNGDVRLYSIRQNEEIGNLPQGGWSVDVYFSPDGKLLATSSDNKKVKLWDMESQSRKRTWKTDERVNFIKWLRGTPWLAIGTDDGELIIESTEQEETVFKGKVMEDRILDMDYLPAEQLLLLCDSWSNILLYKIRIRQP